MTEFTAEKPLLMIPGPVQSDPKVLESMSVRAYSHTESEFVKYFQRALLNLRSIFGAGETSSPLVVAGGGTLAMELALINLVDRSTETRLLVCEAGYFGHRYGVLAERFGIKYNKLVAPVGEAISEEAVRQKLEEEHPTIACIQHVDTSTGVANDIEMFGQVCGEYDVLSIVDGVCALGGERLDQEKWGIDVYLTGAQKALALPPGLAILMFSDRAREATETRKQRIPSYYSDTTNWWPIMDAYLSGSVKYFSTPATNQIVGLATATQNLLDEGMENVYRRHSRLAEKFRSTLTDLGFSFLTKPEAMAVTMTTPKYLDPSHGVEFRTRMLSQGVLIAGGIQSGLADSYFRVGHMGNISEIEIDYTLDAIKRAIE